MKRMVNNFIHVWHRFRDGKNILVYQMGKVGSTALEYSIEGSIHTHMMYGNSPCSVHLKQRRSGVKNRVMGFLGDFIKRVAIKTRGEIKIITLVRDPYQRDVSMFFQDLPHWLYSYVGMDNHDTRSAGYEILFDAFETSYDHRYGIEWFDKEFKRFTGIDVYKYPFDCGLGFSIIRRGKFSVLIMRLENMESLEGVISDFVGFDVEIKSHNSAENKWYAGPYMGFKRMYVPSREYLDEVYGSKFSRHFYSEEEIQDSVRKALGEKSLLGS